MHPYIDFIIVFGRSIYRLGLHEQETLKIVITKKKGPIWYGGGTLNLTLTKDTQKY